MDRAYRQSTRFLSALLVVVGVALVVTTLARGGGAVAVGVVLGIMLVGIGAGRLVIAARTGDDRGRA